MGGFRADQFRSEYMQSGQPVDFSPDLAGEAEGLVQDFVAMLNHLPAPPIDGGPGGV